jgi:predicted hydrocarbon binding protein
MDNKDMIIGEISSVIAELLGSSAAAVMRRAGVKASHRIWPDLPSGLSPEDAAMVMHDGVAQLGGFGSFTLAPSADGVSKIEFENCAFAEFSKTSGFPCGQQPICYFGFGLVEETYKRLTGIRAKVELVKREAQTCFETVTPR